MKQFLESIAYPVLVAAMLGLGALVLSNTVTNAQQDIRLQTLEGVVVEVREVKDVLHNTNLQLERLNTQLEILKETKDDDK